MHIINIVLYSIVFSLSAKLLSTQRTVLDEQFIDIFRIFRLLSFSAIGHTSEKLQNLNQARINGKTQRLIEESSQFPCDVKNGPGRKSDTPPTSVHRLRPGDIDIVGALGDSITAGNGIFASKILELVIENRGISWSIGGQGNWKQYLTLPNILKEFNPKLYGYSLKDGLSIERVSKFNVAEPGAFSADLPYEASVLVKRLNADSRVDMANHWKLFTILIGNNDFCSEMCSYPNPKKMLKWHEKNMLNTLRFLRDNVPRLMVNIVPPPNLISLKNMVGRPSICEPLLHFECPCLIGKNPKLLNYYETIVKDWIKLDSKIAYRDEFNTETFTVNVQPFINFGELKKGSNGKTDLRNFSIDCFHLSQRGQAACANSVWNNMLEPEGEKSQIWLEPLKNVKCPTLLNPYLYTRSNSYNLTAAN